jgi:adenine phosphoribosyltransferase
MEPGTAWPETHRVSLEPDVENGLTLDLPLVQLNSEGFKIYSFNMLGRTSWNLAASKTLARKINKLWQSPVSFCFITAESKAIGLTEQLSMRFYPDGEASSRYVILRKSKKSYMKDCITMQGASITSGRQEYFLDAIDADYIKNKSVIIVDDVISTGSTLETITKLLGLLNCTILCACCALTEGIIWKEYAGIPIVSIDHIPLPATDPFIT